MDYLNSTFNFLTNNTYKATSKIYIIISVVILLLIFDNILGFTYFWNIEKKIYQIDNINIVLKDTSINEGDRKYLISLRHEILERKNIIYYIRLSIENISLNDLTSQLKQISLGSVKRNFILQYISSAFIEILFLFIITISVPSMLKRRQDAGEKDYDIIFKYLLGLIGLLSIGLIHTIIFSFLPIPFNWPVLSYIMNILLNVFLIFLVNKLGSSFPDKSTNQN